MGDFFKPKATNDFAGRLEFGVVKGKVTEITVNRAKSGKGFNVSATIESNGNTAKYASLGYFEDVPATDRVAFDKAKDLYAAWEVANSEAFRINDEVARKEASTKANALRTEYQKQPYFRLIGNLNKMSDFVAGFGTQAREALSGIDVECVEDLLNAFGKIITTSGEAWLVLYESATANAAGKVYQNVNLSQEFQEPKAFPLTAVKDVKPVTKTIEDSDKVLVTGYEVTFTSEKRKPFRLMKTDKTYKGIENKPNDVPNESDVPVVEDGAMPF